MKRILILVVFALLLTGCTAEYNLMINRDLTYRDSFTIRGLPEDYQTREVLASQITQFGENNETLDTFYDLVVQQNDDNYEIFGTGTNPLPEYGNNPVIAEIYENVTVTNEENIYRIEWSGFNNELFTPEVEHPFERITMNVTVPFRVIEHNFRLDRETGNFTANISRFDQEDPLFIEFNINQDSGGQFIEPPETNPLTGIIWIGVGIILLGGLYFVYLKFFAPKGPQYTIKY